MGCFIYSLGWLCDVAKTPQKLEIKAIQSVICPQKLTSSYVKSGSYTWMGGRALSFSGASRSSPWAVSNEHTYCKLTDGWLYDLHWFGFWKTLKTELCSPCFVDIRKDTHLSTSRPVKEISKLSKRCWNGIQIWIWKERMAWLHSRLPGGIDTTVWRWSFCRTELCWRGSTLKWDSFDSIWTMFWRQTLYSIGPELSRLFF